MTELEPVYYTPTTGNSAHRLQAGRKGNSVGLSVFYLKNPHEEEGKDGVGLETI